MTSQMFLDRLLFWEYILDKIIYFILIERFDLIHNTWQGGDKFVRAVLIAGEFEGSLWKAKYLDNESRGSVAVSSKLLFIQFSVKNFPKIAICLYKSITKNARIWSKRPQTFYLNQNKTSRAKKDTLFYKTIIFNPKKIPIPHRFILALLSIRAQGKSTHFRVFYFNKEQVVFVVHTAWVFSNSPLFHPGG